MDWRSALQLPDLAGADHAHASRDKCVRLEHSHKLGKLTFDVSQELLQNTPAHSVHQQSSQQGSASLISTTVQREHGDHGTDGHTQLGLQIQPQYMYTLSQPAVSGCQTHVR